MKLLDDINIKLAESPVIIGDMLYFVDIECGNVHEYNLSTRVHSSFSAGLSVGSSMFTTNRNFILTQEDGIMVRHGTSKNILKNYGIPPEFVSGIHRFNDGKVGPDGRLYAGVMIKDSAQRRAHPGAASLWSLDSAGTFTKILGDLTTPNGMVWSNPSSTRSEFYYIDSRRQNILSGMHIFLPTPSFEINDVLISFDPKCYETPDGMTLLKNGELLVAFYRSSLLLRIDPRTREVIEEIKVAYPYPTSVVASTSTIYVTHAHHEDTPGCVSVLPGLGVESVEPNYFIE